VVSLGNVLVKITVLAPCVVVINIVEAGRVLPGAVETKVWVSVAPACVRVAPAIVVVIVPAAKDIVCWASEMVEM
jgi:hypothetical protein